MNLRYYIIAGLLLAAFTGSAQDTYINGVVINKSTSQRVSNALVTNRSGNVSVSSNELGIFRIRASVGDTLDLAKSGFAQTIITVLSLQDLAIQLQPAIEINEVIITEQSRKQEMDEVRNQYRKQGSFHGGKPPLLSFIFNPLTAVYELIGKTPGRARRFNNYYYRELEQLDIDKRFNTTKVSELTGFEGKDLQNFMDTYRPQYEDLSGWDEYKLISYIKASAHTFYVAGKPSAVGLPPLPKAPDLSDKPVKN